MSTELAQNVAHAGLRAPATAGATSISVELVTGAWPTVPFAALLEDDTSHEEQVLVTGVSGNTLTVTRAQGGTTAVAHDTMSSVDVNTTLADIGYLETVLAAGADLPAHVAAADPHVGYLKEADVNAKGDLYAGTANDTVSRLAVGTNDHVLTADSAQATGLKWAASGVAAHEADTTSIHGITNTAVLVASGQTAVVGLGVAAEATRQLLVKGQATTDTVLVVRGIASQSGNLVELQDSTGAAVMKFDVGGNITANTFQPIQTPGTGTYVAFNSNQLQLLQRSEGALVVAVRGAASQTGDLMQWQASNGAALFSVLSDGKVQFVAANEQTTVGAAGGGAGVPATATKYFKVKDSAGTTLVIPAFAAA